MRLAFVFSSGGSAYFPLAATQRSLRGHAADRFATAGGSVASVFLRKPR